MNQKHIEELIDLIYKEYNWIEEAVLDLANKYGLKYINSGQEKHVFGFLNDTNKVLKITKQPNYNILYDEIANR